MKAFPVLAMPVPSSSQGAPHRRAAQPGGRISRPQSQTTLSVGPTPMAGSLRRRELTRLGVFLSALPRDWEKGDPPQVLIFGAPDDPKPSNESKGEQREHLPSTPRYTSQSPGSAGRRRARQDRPRIDKGGAEYRPPAVERGRSSPPGRQQSSAAEEYRAEQEARRPRDTQGRSAEAAQPQAPSRSEVEDALSRFNAAVGGQKSAGTAGPTPSAPNTIERCSVQDMAKKPSQDKANDGLSASGTEQFEVYEALSRFKSAAAKSRGAAGRPAPGARRKADADTSAYRPLQRRRKQREEYETEEKASRTKKPEVKGPELGWGSFDAEAWDEDDGRDWSAGGYTQRRGWDGEIEADAGPQRTAKAQSSNPDNFKDEGFSEASGRVPEVELLSPEEAQRVMPQAPLPGQVSYYRGDIVQTVGLSFALLVLGSAFTQTTPLAIGAATYPFWGPIGQAAVRNLRLGRYPCCGLWKATVIDVSLERGLGRAASSRQGQRRGVSLAVITLGDGSGARTRVEIETSAPAGLLRGGMAVEALVVSEQEDFQRFKVVRELYLPEANFWLSDYPFYNQREFLRLRSVLSQEKSPSRDSARQRRSRYY